MSKEPEQFLKHILDECNYLIATTNQLSDRLIHDYIGVNYSIVWDVIINKIPSLKKQIDSVLNG